MTTPGTTTQTNCPVCRDTDAQVTFDWSVGSSDTTTARQLVVTGYECRNGCSLDDRERPTGPYGPTTADIRI